MPLKLEEFKANRKEQCNTAVKILDTVWESQKNGSLKPARAVVQAPVKCGKREIAEILAVLVNQYKEIGIGLRLKDVVFLTALNRKDIQEQFEEQKSYGLTTICVSNVVARDEAIEFLKQYPKGELLVLIDEADYGTHVKQLLSRVYKMATKTLKHPIVMFSATNEEALLSDIMKDGATEIRHIPNIRYNGASRFLTSGLVIQAEQFYNAKEGTLTNQGHEVMEEFYHDDKAIGVLRLNEKGAAKHFVENKPLRTSLIENGVEVMFVNADSSFKWGEDGHWVDRVNLFKSRRVKTLIVINQTCKRSTEIKFHPYLSFWHDFPARGANYNTIHQAQGRVFHHAPISESEDFIYPIKLYTDKFSMEFAAGEMSSVDYEMLTGRKLSGRHTAHQVFNHNVGGAVFPTFEECVAFGKKMFPNRSNQKHDYKVGPDGRLLAHIRGASRSLTVSSTTFDDLVKEVDAMRDRGGGINEGTPTRIHPVWNTTLNKQMYVVFYWKGEAEKTVTGGVTAPTSMFNS
jgi:hypothetical protein